MRGGVDALSIDDIADLRTLLTAAINPDTPMTDNEGKIILRGFNAELDELRNIQTNAKQ